MIFGKTKLDIVLNKEQENELKANRLCDKIR